MVELLMSVLTEKQKEILKKVYWEQKTHKQIDEYVWNEQKQRV